MRRGLSALRASRRGMGLRQLSSGLGVRLSPAAAWHIGAKKLDPQSIPATGKGGRITKQDVILALEKGSAKKLISPISPSKPASSPSTGRRRTRPVETIDITPMRQAIANRMVESKTYIPHEYVTMDCDLTGVTALMKSLADGGYKLSLNSFIIKATASALQDVPEVNAFYDGSSHERVQLSNVDVSVAVAVDEGLITPIVRNANFKRVGQIQETVKDMATRARNNQLKPEEYTGGSFTVSNLGMFGITHFKAVVTPPQVGILALGTTQHKPFAKPKPKANIAESKAGKSETGVDGDEDFLSGTQGETELAGVAPFMQATLSVDGRAVDGPTASRWLDSFRKHLENPLL